MGEIAVGVVLFGLFVLILLFSVFQIRQLERHATGISGALLDMQTRENQHGAIVDAMWEASPQAMYLTGPDGSTTWVNDAYLKLWGITATEAHSDAWLDKLTDEARTRAINRVAHVFTNHEPFSFDDLETVDGRTLKIVGGPVFCATGEFTGYAGTITDVSA